ncbi:hypothetical protein RHMOL_Rhmol07G0075200 [Rhododendron molle]|uniref:Uncharacterized protein n=1 Tax=Rhododendron molle TaxID=49168 RepID=A0ACC0MYF0_RHOML|nr:hypothetical protein RHMOL_Rhmol07G0075200 [Rhododendron molle]
MSSLFVSIEYTHCSRQLLQTNKNKINQVRVPPNKVTETDHGILSSFLLWQVSQSQACCNCIRRNAVDPYPILSQLGCNTLSQSRNSMLGTRVCMWT